MKANENNTIQVFWVGLGTLTRIFLSLITAAILSRYFDKTEYGTYRQVLYVYTTLLIVFTAGLPKVYAYFLPRYPIHEGKHIVQKITRALFFSGVFFSLFLFLFSNVIATFLKNPHLAEPLRLFSIVPTLLLPTLGIEGIFSTYKKTIFVAIYNSISRLVLLACILIPVLVFKGNIIHLMYGWILGAAFSFILAMVLNKIPFKGVDNKPTNLFYREILEYSLPLVAASIGGVMIKAADQFYISRYFGAEVFAEFSNGFFPLPFVGMITGATSVVLMPQFSKMVNNKIETSKLTNLWRGALVKSGIIIYPLVIFFMCYSTEVVTLLFSEQYAASAIYFRLALAINFFNIIIVAPLVLSLGKSKFYAQMHLLLMLIVWPAEYLIVFLFNSPVALVIFSSAFTILKIIIFLRYTTKLINVPFFNMIPIKTLFKILVHASIVILFLHYLIDIYLSNMNLVLMLSISFALYTMLILLTSKIFKIDYLSVVKPIFHRMKLNF